MSPNHNFVVGTEICNFVIFSVDGCYINCHLNFYEVARDAFFSKCKSEARSTKSINNSQYFHYRFTTYQDARRVRLVDGLETNILRVSPVNIFSNLTVDFI